MCFNPFLANDSLNDSNQNPDVNFYNGISSFATSYLSLSKIDKNFQNFSKESFFVLHLNIRSMNKSLNTKFSITCLTETWANDSNIKQNSFFQLEEYIPVNKIRNSHKRGGIVIFILDSLLYKLCTDLSINREDIESLSTEILNSQTKNVIFNVIYMPPNGNLNVCETFLKKILSDSTTVNKTFFLAGDFNIILKFTSSTLKQTKKPKVL